MDEAVRVTAEVLDGWAPAVAEAVLVAASHGRFEVRLDGEVLFDRKAEGRMPRPGEVAAAVEGRLGPRLPWRG
ncbi:MAG: Rdx family protein [Candidatus Dormibacterales bacterium]